MFRATKIIQSEPLTVDLLEVSPSYAEAWNQRQTVRWQERLLTVVSRGGLILMKQMSTRLKDKADLETLEGKLP